MKIIAEWCYNFHEYMTFVITRCTYFQLAAFLSAYGCDMFGLLINGRLVGRYTAAGVYGRQAVSVTIYFVLSLFPF